MFTWRIAVLAFVCIVFAVPPAYSQVKHNAPFSFAPITVTAQKVEQDIREVPGTVTAFPEEKIEAHNISSVYGLIEYLPNVTVQKNANENIITIRGVSPFGTSLFSPTVFYVDGINYPIHQMQNLELLDVQRVEVLKGPQGTLYGRNSEAGVLSISTNPPEETLSGKISATAGIWDSRGDKPLFKESGIFNLPLVKDTLSLRVAVQHHLTDGWMRNTEGGPQPTRASRFQDRVNALWTPSDDMKISFLFESQHRDDGMGVYRFVNGPGKTKKNTLAWNANNRNIVDADSQSSKLTMKQKPSPLPLSQGDIAIGRATATISIWGLPMLSA